MLSERVRPNSEAAPWVIAEIQKLENEIERLRKQVSDLHELVALATEIKPVYRRFEEKWGDIYVPRRAALKGDE